MKEKNVTVSIIGRPNVGKSTLFNRLSGQKNALTGNVPGITRDRREGYGKIAEMSFRLIDTAGFENAKVGTLEKKMFEQTKEVFKETDIFLMLINSKEGVLSEDIALAKLIKNSGISTILLLNKSDGKTNNFVVSDAWKFGLGEPIPISAEHGDGMVEIFNSIMEIAKDKDFTSLLFDNTVHQKVEYINLNKNAKNIRLNDTNDSDILNLSVVGRPNMGKSTLVNSLLGENRLLTGPEQGITRDAIVSPFFWNKKNINLIDTAGIRKKSKVDELLEKMVVKNALRAIQFSHVCILTIDARQKIKKQDLALARLITDEGRALIIAANMWDDIKNTKQTLETLRYKISKSLSQLEGIPIVPISGLYKTGIKNLMKNVENIFDTWNLRISTNKLNKWLLPILENHPPPLSNGRRIKIRYITQIKNRPPTFILFCNLPSKLPKSYFRYLLNKLRNDFGIIGVPIRISLKKGENPFIK